METISINQPINLKVVKFELDFTSLNSEPKPVKKKNKIKVPQLRDTKIPSKVPPPPPLSLNKDYSQKQNVKQLVENLLNELYGDQQNWSNDSVVDYSQGSTSAASVTSCTDQTDAIERNYLESLDIYELKEQTNEWENRLKITGERLARSVRIRDRLRRQQKRLCAAFTVLLRHITGESGAKFGVSPGDEGEGPGEGGYAEWLHAMRLVARLPAGVPLHFRKKLWLTLAERHLTARGVDWSTAERAAFCGTAQPDDTELGAQILKDLHRTGCSLFCGTEGRENQAMLRRVLLAYARWNKDVGYCQGFNMLAAIILEVMEKSESDSLKVMIYLVEAVLPEGYFADDLRGLSADMAAFRDLLRLRLPRLANHMDHLQRISDGGGVEPPLPDVFTMQWFLTLYATWLPRDSLLRIWDLILLDGNEILLLTALAIWDMLQDRILSARSADEFYSCMGGGASAVWAAGDGLVAKVVTFGSVPELPRLRSLHRYRVTPPAPPNAPPVYQPPLHSAMQSMTKRGLRLFYSEDEGDSSDDGNKMALATVIPRRENRVGAGDRLSLDIGALKRQYARLRERQRQAHVILAAACARHAAVGVPTSPTSLTVNNLLLGKSAIVSSRGRRLGPPPGAVPPSRQALSPRENTELRPRGRSNDTISWKEEQRRKSLSRRNSLKWKDIKKEKPKEKNRKASIDLDEAGDGIIVSELEANEMIASLRSRSSSETSSYSSHTASSTDTSLCDDNEKASDSESDLVDDDNEKKYKKHHDKKLSPGSTFKENKLIRSPVIKETKIKHSPEVESKTISSEKSVKDITDYLDSAAGEPLRAYIDGFETKLKDNNLILSSESEIYKPLSPYKSISPYSPLKTPEKSDILQKLTRIKCDDTLKYSETVKPMNLIKTSKNFTELSPIDLSPCNCSVERKSPYDYDFESNFKHTSFSKISISSRPPDLIDSFTMYPNFVPDIDLSDKNISDVESPPRSPGADSIIVSEDEPPIQLKIDKYFEHSPEFFGARVTDPNNSDIPNRRPTKRYSRLPKKPDSLTLHVSTNEKLMKSDVERASSLPQSHSFSNNPISNIKQDNGSDDKHKEVCIEKSTILTPKSPKTVQEMKKDDSFSPKDYILRSGRKNSERALQIIQENSKILSRILTKQNIADTNKAKKFEDIKNLQKSIEMQRTENDECITEKSIENKLVDSPILKESTSDSLIGYRKNSINNVTTEKSEFVRIRPISIDDPFSLEVHNVASRNEDFSLKTTKTPSTECLGNKTDFYGWENKGFLAKCDYKNTSTKPESSYDYDIKNKILCDSRQDNLLHNELKLATTSEWSRHSFSGDSRSPVSLPSAEPKDLSTYDKHFTPEDYNYPLSSKYNDFILSKASDICSKTVDQGPKVCENLLKTENSQVSDFTNVVTSSISFTYERSVDDDSPIEVKSNSSDTLCQITSLDQVSTPISPKIFPRDTPILTKDTIEKSDKTKIESDDTCSGVTSLLETDTLSSISYPRSPSSGSYHPFPTRPAMRMPKELGIRLGMYPKDTMNSPPK